MIEEWLNDIKKNSDNKDLGMILIHNGIVRATSREGKPVNGMFLSYDKARLDELVKEMIKKDGIIAIKVWINEGKLKVGDDIMIVLVAGRFRRTVIPVFEELVSRIKKEIVTEDEFFST